MNVRITKVFESQSWLTVQRTNLQTSGITHIHFPPFLLFFSCKNCRWKRQENLQAANGYTVLQSLQSACAIYIPYNSQVLRLRNKPELFTPLYLLATQGIAFRYILLCCTFKLLEFCMQSKRLYVFVCFALKAGKNEMMQKVILSPIFISVCL